MKALTIVAYVIELCGIFLLSVEAIKIENLKWLTDRSWQALFRFSKVFDDRNWLSLAIRGTAFVSMTFLILTFVTALSGFLFILDEMNQIVLWRLILTALAFTGLYFGFYVALAVVVA